MGVAGGGAEVRPYCVEKRHEKTTQMGLALEASDRLSVTQPLISHSPYQLLLLPVAHMCREMQI